MDLGLTDKVYVVTGGSRGLGRATAAALVSDGARVVVSSRSQDSVDAAVADLGDDRAAGVAGDNADPDAADQLVARAIERFGRLDGAVISVGGPPAGGVREITDEQWRQAFESVFLGAVRMARTVAGAMSGGGSIVFVLSTSVKAPIAGLAISNGLRPGLAMIAKTLADELGPQGIRVNGLLPGRIETERVQELDNGTPDPAATKRGHLAAIPLGRYGDPAEFGAVAAFLLSPAAGYVNGAMIPVDGGITRAL